MDEKNEIPCAFGKPSLFGKGSAFGKVVPPDKPAPEPPQPQPSRQPRATSSKGRVSNHHPAPDRASWAFLARLEGPFFI